MHRKAGYWVSLAGRETNLRREKLNTRFARAPAIFRDWKEKGSTQSFDGVGWFLESVVASHRFVTLHLNFKTIFLFIECAQIGF